jgi:diguanylate cyclase (GGDEF)-like protein
MERIMDTTMAQLGALLQVDVLCVYWVAPTGDTLVLEAARPALAEDARHTVHIDDGFIGRTLYAHAPLRSDPSTDGAQCLLGVGMEVRSMIAVPLRMGARPLGVLLLGRQSGELFTEDDVNFLGSLARVLTLAIENAKLFERAQELSLSDELTSLGNRRLFNLRLASEIARTRATGAPLCLVMLDLDFFKRINDQYGHPAGDEVLRQFTRLVQHDVRGNDLLCRIGGEEFALMVLDAVVLEAYAIAQRICRRIAETPFVLDDGTAFTMTVSAGVAHLDGAMHTVEDFVTAADRALYTAKANGRNRVEVFTPETSVPLPDPVPLDPERPEASVVP